MPVYSKQLLLPIVGTKDNETRVDIAVVEGILSNLQILFPSGHAGLTHLRIMDGEQQIIPTNLGEYFVGDNVLISFSPDQQVMGQDIPIGLVGFNEDDTFPHTVYVYMQIDATTTSPSAIVARILRIGNE